MSIFRANFVLTVKWLEIFPFRIQIATGFLFSLALFLTFSFSFSLYDDFGCARVKYLAFFVFYNWSGKKTEIESSLRSRWKFTLYTCTNDDATLRSNTVHKKRVTNDVRKLSAWTESTQERANNQMTCYHKTINDK